MSGDPIKRYTLLVLFQAQQDRATELRIAPAGGGTQAPIMYKVRGAWYGMSPPPEFILPGVLAELGRLAALSEKPFPREGLIDVQFSGLRLRWVARMASADSDCVLTPIEL